MPDLLLTGAAELPSKRRKVPYDTGTRTPMRVQYSTVTVSAGFVAALSCCCAAPLVHVRVLVRYGQSWWSSRVLHCTVLYSTLTSTSCEAAAAATWSTQHIPLIPSLSPLPPLPNLRLCPLLLHSFFLLLLFLLLLFLLLLTLPPSVSFSSATTNYPSMFRSIKVPL